MRALSDVIAGADKDYVPGEHVVYVLEDAKGDVVYVGRSVHLPERLRGHRSVAPWWSEVDSVWWLICRDAVHARLAEREYIAKFTPRGNTNDHLPVRGARVELPQDTVRDLRHLVDAAYRTGKDSPENLRLNGFILALRRAGWPLAAIGKPLGYTREAIRLREQRALPVDGLPPVPAPPHIPTQAELQQEAVAARRAARLAPLRPDVVSRMQELAAQARTVNGTTPAGDPRRRASVELTELIAAVLAEGATIGGVARALGVTYPAIRFRLGRHGYLTLPDSQAHSVYKGRPRAQVLDPSAPCSRGHARTPENVRFINGDPSRRVCRPCERIHQENYRRRLAGAA